MPPGDTAVWVNKDITNQRVTEVSGAWTLGTLTRAILQKSFDGEYRLLMCDPSSYEGSCCVRAIDKVSCTCNLLTGTLL